MFKNLEVGLQVVLTLSFIYALLGAFSQVNNGNIVYVIGVFFGIFIASLVILFIIYWIIWKLYPKSEHWGSLLWTVILFVAPLAIIFALIIAAGFVSGLTSNVSSSSNYQWVQYSNYGITFNYPSSIPINTSAPIYATATYYKGGLLFENPLHQQILVMWVPEGNDLSQVSQQQKYFSLFASALQKNGVADFTESSIRETTHAGQTVYYVTGNGHYSGYNLNLGYYVIAIWEDPQSQRDFIISTISYRSQDDTQALFNGVLNSFEGH
jgi:hypothetical protein